MVTRSTKGRGLGQITKGKKCNLLVGFLVLLGLALTERSSRWIVHVQSIGLGH